MQNFWPSSLIPVILVGAVFRPDSLVEVVDPDFVPFAAHGGMAITDVTVPALGRDAEVAALQDDADVQALARSARVQAGRIQIDIKAKRSKITL